VPSDDRWEQFDGYDPPRYTPVPDDLFDWQLRDLGLAELKVLLFIIRKTLGYKKNEDAISLTQICEATGLGRKAVSQAVKTLEDRRAIHVVRRKSSRGDAAINMYVLNIKGQEGSILRKLPWFPEETTLVSSGNPQEGILQEETIQGIESESPAVENSRRSPFPTTPHRRPSGDSFSTIQQIARRASQLLNEGRQYQSILGFLIIAITTSSSMSVKPRRILGTPAIEFETATLIVSHTASLAEAPRKILHTRHRVASLGGSPSGWWRLIGGQANIVGQPLTPAAT